MERVWTVTELTSQIKEVLETSFPFVWVEGEISNLRMPTSGHIYFSLKDKESQIRIVIFRYLTSSIKFKLKDGLKVLIFGRVSIYGARSEYQVIGERVEPRGVGALQLAFEELKKRLSAEGLFAEEHKRPIPFLIQRLGVITSPTGAAIKDILKVIGRRNPNVEVIINPVFVQGKESASQIVKAISAFNEMGSLDAIILGRGGGSLEDLWSFNEEVVARAIYNSNIPIISAVGHEIDYTIADFVADLRAPTPSAAAELVVLQKEELVERLKSFQDRILFSTQSIINHLKERLKSLSSRYIFQKPVDYLYQLFQRVDDLEDRLNQSFFHIFQLKREYTRAIAQRLNGLSPLAILERGYSLTFTYPEKRIIKSAKKLSIGNLVESRLARGSFISEVKKIEQP